MKSKNIRLIGWSVLLILVLALSGCAGSGSPAAGTAEPTKAVAASNAAASSAGTSVAGVQTTQQPESLNAVMAEGRVVPMQDASLTFSTSGVVSDVLVAEGDAVRAGQVLARLAGNEKMQAAVTAAELELLTSQNELQTLKNNADVVRSQAQLNLAQAQKELDKAKNRMYSKDYSRGDKDQIDAARAHYIVALDGIDKAEEFYNKFSGLPEDDPNRAEAFSQLVAARQQRDVALGNLNYLMNKPSQLDIDEVTAKLAVAQAAVDEAQRKYDLVKDGPDANQLVLSEARLRNAEVSLNAAKASLADLELKSPITGTISTLDLKQGETASMGKVVITVADFSNWLVQTTDVTELNVARVKIGQPALVRFDALPGKDFIGRVTKIDTFGENRQGDIVYTVELKLESSDPALRWNMTASLTFLEKEAE